MYLLSKVCDFDSFQNIEAAIQKAKNSDIILACMGEYPSTEKPGDIHSLEMERAQLDYIKELSTLGKPIILVLVQNRTRIIREIEPLCSAIIMAYQPSENGSLAVSDVLNGKVNPSGKLPVTYPRNVNSLLLYDHRYTDELNIDFGLEAFNPQYEFGHGLSYTNFNYSDLNVNVDSTKQQIHIQVKVTNTGTLDGKETVLAFVSDNTASVAPSVKRLRYFEKSMISSGETKLLDFSIDWSDLAFVNANGKWIREKGSYTITIGNLTQNIYF